MKSSYSAILTFVIIPVVAGGLLYLLHPVEATWTAPAPSGNEVTMQEINSWQFPVIWVDARSEPDGTDQQVSAVSLNPSNFDIALVDLLEQWQPGDRIVVFCDTRQCGNSHEVASRLTDEVGLDEVYVLFGGWEAREDTIE